MEKFETKVEQPDTQTKLRRCQVINVILIVVIVILILVLCIALPLVAQDDDDDGASKSSTGNGGQPTQQTGSSTPSDSAGNGGQSKAGPIPFSRAVQPCNISSFAHQDVWDVIVVGAGPGGTFSGYRLRKEKPEWSVLLLEATNRIGGRLYSEHLPDINFNVAELGGMRYIPEAHPFFAKVIETLNISDKPFLMAEENEDRPYLLRDIFVKQRDLRTAGEKAFRLNEEERGKSPDELSKMIFESMVPLEERGKSPDKMNTIYGDALLRYGTLNTYNLVNASDDAHNYVILANGYSIPYSNDNAVVSIAISNDTALSEGYRAPVNGMAEVPKQLAKQFINLGGKVHMNRTVTQIDECEFPNTTKLYMLTTYNYATLETKVYFARKVILAMTFSQLRRLHWDALWTSKKRNLLNSAITFESSKIFLAFEEPWWRKESLRHLNLTHGRTISSLPSRQTFYFTAPDPQASNRSFIMLYNDGQFAKFWKALASEHFDSFSTASSAVFPMTETLVNEVVRELAINHNTTEDVIGRPYFGWIMVWDPTLLPKNVEGYGPYMPSEAWALWAPGYNFTEVTKDIVKLDDNQDVFVCGSVFSLSQGWADGAMMHADEMLTKYFNIPSYLESHVMKRHVETIYGKRMIPLWP